MDKLRGLMFGSALADAIGLIGEFKKKEDISEIIFPYKKNIRDWVANDWTNNTDQMILLLELMIEDNVTPHAFAKKIQDWGRSGFPELGDESGVGMGGSTSGVIFNKNFLKEPFRVAETFWKNSGRVIAPNGSLMRTAVLSFCDNYLKVSYDMCRVTHTDPRCVASCLVLNHAIHLIRIGQIENLTAEASMAGFYY